MLAVPRTIIVQQPACAPVISDQLMFFSCSFLTLVACNASCSSCSRQSTFCTGRVCSSAAFHFDTGLLSLVCAAHLNVCFVCVVQMRAVFPRPIARLLALVHVILCSSRF